MLAGRREGEGPRLQTEARLSPGVLKGSTLHPLITHGVLNPLLGRSSPLYDCTAFTLLFLAIDVLIILRFTEGTVEE